MSSQTLWFPLGASERGDASAPTVCARVEPTAHDASVAVAREIAQLIRDRAARGRRAVLGLATGSTPVAVYDELVRLHKSEGLSFRNVVTFNLDEYWPMTPDSLQSYHRFMAEHFFDHVDVERGNVHIPDGTLPQASIAAFCRAYEEKIAAAGGIDLQLLGIGRTGHIGFNEPGSPRDSRTRLITLDKVTRLDAASDFFGEWNVPRRAITMGVGTILSARRVVLLAFGEGKARILREAIEGPITSSVAASHLQQHPNVQFVLDRAAANELTPIKTPWRLGPLAPLKHEWDERTTRKAVIWLALSLKKPILKLVEEDYNEHGLQELLSARGSAYDLNIQVFRAMQDTITGWPGGKPGRPRRDGSADEFPKRVVVFSPHPDDDVISMGGTLIRLCDQGHDVHVAYQTSGNIAVFDDKTLRHVEFVSEFAQRFELPAGGRIEAIARQVSDFIRGKNAGEVDPPEMQSIKALIRRSEARAAARYSGVEPANVHFLDLPFYETGRVRKKPIGEADIAITRGLLEQVRPRQVYAAGDLSDPHGTHRVCLDAILTALRRMRQEAAEGRQEAQWSSWCEVWLYRGAWQEWEPHEIEMAVPLSPDEVERKRMAIFFHESQKDKALFPGPWDTREFWKRAEDRNAATARVYDELGLPEYQAIEAFVRWQPEAQSKGANEPRMAKSE